MLKMEAHFNKNNKDIQQLKSQLLNIKRNNKSDTSNIELSEVCTDVSKFMQKITGESELLEIDTKRFRYNQDVYNILHVKEDYIPYRIEKDLGFYELNFLEILQFFHEKNQVIIDVGANIGNHTIFFSKVMGAEVAAIEPEPHNHLLLWSNTIINDIEEDVHLYRYAIGEEDGSMTIEMNVESNFGSFTRDVKANPNGKQLSLSRKVSVPVLTLDKTLIDITKNKKISIIKIDVEGMEIEVLRGASQIISSSLPIISVECFKKEDLLAAENILKPYNYFVFESANATPTFIFASRDNNRHLEYLNQYLRFKAMKKVEKQMYRFN